MIFIRLNNVTKSFTKNSKENNNEIKMGKTKGWKLVTFNQILIDKLAFGLLMFYVLCYCFIFF